MAGWAVHARFGNRRGACPGASCFFLIAARQPSSQHCLIPHLHHPPGPLNTAATLRAAAILPRTSLELSKMLACRSFAAPARQCLRRANASHKWAPALIQVRTRNRATIADENAVWKKQKLTEFVCTDPVALLRCRTAGQSSPVQGNQGQRRKTSPALTMRTGPNRSGREQQNLDVGADGNIPPG